MKKIMQIIDWLSSLKTAIILLIVIAIASSIGTIIPQGEPIENYLNKFNSDRLFGLIDGKGVIFLQINHVYTSTWFLMLLIMLGLSLTICSWKRQFPMLRAALKWIDYKHPKQIAKLTIAQSIRTKDPLIYLENLKLFLQTKGWKVNENEGRIAARKGAIGRLGPMLIHFGMIILMLGSTYGALSGQKVEKFLVPGRSIELLNLDNEKQLNILLEKFVIDRDPQGRAEQFRSLINLNHQKDFKTIEEISVNHPLRYRGITIYQADWALAAITVQIGNSPPLQIPVKPIQELGEQVWGTIIPTNKEGSNNILLTLSSEEGPINIYDSDGSNLAKLRPGSDGGIINNTKVKVLDVLPSSGLLIKYDPSVPFVYLSFAIILAGGFLSIFSTKQIWALSEVKENESLIHIGGLSNRNIYGFSHELPGIISNISTS